MQNNPTNELYHRGILGMRWGHRKSADSSGSSSQSSSIKNKKTDTSHLTDEELKKVVARLQMEKQYSQLSSEKISKGKKHVDNLVKAGTTVATLTTTGLTIYNNAEKIKEILKSK